MREVVHHVALALAGLGLAHAALRVADRVSPGGLERALAAAVVGVCATVVQALVLGLAGLGGSAPALVAAAGATWAAAMLLLPRPGVAATAELAAWWRRRTGSERACAAALAGAGGAWLVWQLRHPSIGFDGALYHYPLVAGWIESGRPGTDIPLSYDIPYGSYPLTDEVAQTWAAAIARSWIPLSLWNPAMLVLLGLATWQALRTLAVRPPAAGLATAALVVTPMLVRQLNEPQTDLPSLAWLACAFALALGAARRPALLAIAMAAVGLAVGTKTSAAPLGLAALAIGAYLARGRLRPHLRSLALGAVVACVVGGVWFAGNLIRHGSPLWPFVETPWGDPSPEFLGRVDKTFAQRPLDTLDGRLDEYAVRLGGTWLLFLPAVLAPAAAVVARRWEPSLRRGLAVGGCLSAAGLLTWSVAWGTGLQTTALAEPASWPISALRYMLPAIGASLATVALATRAPGRAGVAATALLALVLAWSTVASARIGAPLTPPAWTLAAGGAVGLALLAAGAAARRGLEARGSPLRSAPAGSVAVAAAIVLGTVAAPASNGFVERYTRVRDSSAFGREVVAWHLRRPGFADGDQPVAFASRGVMGLLAGDHFTHRLELVPARVRCERLDRLVAGGFLVVTEPIFFERILGVNPYTAPRCVRGRPAAFRSGPFAVLDRTRDGSPAARNGRR